MAYKLELLESSRVHPIFHVSFLKKVIDDKLPVQTVFPEINEEGKIILEPKVVTEQEPDNYGIDQFQSISLSWRIYLLNIPHGRMRILYKIIQSYSSAEDNTFLKDRGMLGPYITSVVPLLLFLYPYSPHIVIIVPLQYYF